MFEMVSAFSFFRANGRSSSSSQPVGHISDSEDELPERSRLPITCTKDLPSEDLPAADVFEKSLENAKAEVVRDNADFVYYLLQDTRRTLTQLNPRVLQHKDKQSPFSGLTSITTPRTAKYTPKGNLVIDQIPAEQKRLRLKVNLKSYHSSVERVPAYEHYIDLESNLLMADNVNLRFEPYLGDDLSQEQQETWRAELKERFKKLNTSVENRINNRSSQLINQLQCHMPEVVLNQIEHNEIFKKCIGVDMDVLRSENASSQLTSSSTSQSILRSSQPISQQRHTMDSLCMICNVYACKSHGEYRQLNDHPQGDYTSLVPTTSDHNSTKEKWHNDSAMGLLTKQYELDDFGIDRHSCCSKRCFLNFDEQQTPAKTSLAWSERDLACLTELLGTSLKDHARSSCIISAILDRDCDEVQHKIVEEDLRDDEEVTDLIRETRTLKWYNPKTRRIQYEGDFSDITQTHRHELRDLPKGCTHPGKSCDQAGHDDCDCVDSNVLCNKFCSCPADCHLRFNGCNCAQFGATCSTSRCPCRLLNRECDPDLCHRCGAEDVADPMNRTYQLPLKICQNANIQRGVPIPLIVGESSIPGCENGIFTAIDCTEGTYISEYHGEIISDPEGIRRQSIYDKKSHSYLFDLNKHWVVDSARYGSLTRFMNSSKTPNVTPRVMMVNMTHRIGFYALKNIAAGEELFFDYGPTFMFDKLGNKNKARKSTGREKTSPAPKVKVEKEDNMLGLEFDINEPLPIIDEGEASEFEGAGVASGSGSGSDIEVDPRPRKKRITRKPVRYRDRM